MAIKFMAESWCVMARKTFNVGDFVRLVNRRLVETPDVAVRERLTICSMVEMVLMDSDQYKGFRYLGAGNEAGQLDDSRRAYYVAGGL